MRKGPPDQFAAGAAGDTRALLEMSAMHSFEGLCRETLTRIWDRQLPMAAWLATNPSVAGAVMRDPTDRRFEHFSRKVGAGGYYGVNIRSWCATKPADMMRAVKEGRYTLAMHNANIAAVAAVARQAKFHFVAFGPDIARQHRDVVNAALRAFCETPATELLCLRTTADGWPCHPLARGKLAIPNSTTPSRWSAPDE